MSYHFLMDLALILLATKILGLMTRRVQMPQVVGALLAGLLLGPAELNVLHDAQFLGQISKLGVIVILFQAGLGTDIRELKAAGKTGFTVASFGVIVPLILGTLLTLFAEKVGLIEPRGFLEALFIGTVLTATSVSITVETLKELGRLDSHVGAAILAAALIDDVLGLIALTVVSGLASDSVEIGLMMMRILSFFIFVAVVSWPAHTFFKWMMERANGRNLRRFSVLSFVFCLLMAYCAEELFGVADIIGAFAAGLVISDTPKGDYVQMRFEPLGYLLLIPVFFANVGVQTVIESDSTGVLVFAFLLLAVAILSKFIGCGLGARMCGTTWREAAEVGAGMACRGEVALVVANSGMALGVLSPVLMTPIVITVVGCAILTPIMMKFAAPTHIK